MPIVYSATRANLSSLGHQHPAWSHRDGAAATGSSKEGGKKWLKRLREELAARLPLQQLFQGHAPARKTPPATTPPLVVQTLLALGARPPEG